MPQTNTALAPRKYSTYDARRPYSQGERTIFARRKDYIRTSKGLYLRGDSQKKKVMITGTALFPGDILPELPVIAGGRAEIFGVERQIVQGRKNRNPDGTVNYTEVWLE